MSDAIDLPAVDADSFPLVWIVVVHLSGVDMTRACLDSLKTLSWVRYRVLLVDNGSSDRDGALLQASLPWVSLLRMNENTGFSGGCNAGIAYAQEHGADFIWLLNNDATVYPETLSRLLTEASENPRAGVLGGAVIEPDGSESKATGMGFVDYKQARIYSTGVSTGPIQPCDWVCGANMLLRATALDDAGAFDDDYFLYCEDVELCVRLCVHKWECLYVPQAWVEHAGRGSTGNSRALWKYYYSARNRLFFFERYASRSQWYRCLSHFLLKLMRHVLLFPVSSKNKRTKTRGEILALYDFLSGHRGKRNFL